MGQISVGANKVTFDGDSIHVRSYSGTDIFTTGYLGASGEHARYEFDGLSIAGKTIIGFTAYSFDNFLTSGTDGLAAASPSAFDLVHLDLATDTVSLDLDSIVFADRNTGSGLAHADFRIDLVTQDNGGNGGGNNLPEPATLALFLIAALGAGAARRRA